MAVQRARSRPGSLRAEDQAVAEGESKQVGQRAVPIRVVSDQQLHSIKSARPRPGWLECVKGPRPCPSLCPAAGEQSRTSFADVWKMYANSSPQGLTERAASSRHRRESPAQRYCGAPDDTTQNGRDVTGGIVKGAPRRPVTFTATRIATQLDATGENRPARPSRRPKRKPYSAARSSIRRYGVKPTYQDSGPCGRKDVRAQSSALRW